jgi:integrase
MSGADPVAVAIERFSSRTLSEAAVGFAQTLTTAAGPTGANRTKAWLFAASRLAAFGETVGLELEPAVLLHPSVIERCCMPGATTMRPVTRRTVRTNLRAMARRVLPASSQPAPLPRERAKAPYAPTEIAAFLALADAQPTPLRRARAGALICLGAGAGLIGGELRRVRGSDVVARSGGLLVEVGGRRPRAVPVLVSYHDRLAQTAEFFGAAYLVSGTNPDSHNVTNPLIRSLSGGGDLPRLEPGRLRSSWLVTVAEGIGLRAFMDAAGVTCSQRLGDLVSYLEPAGEAEAVAVCGGAT